MYWSQIHIKHFLAFFSSYPFGSFISLCYFSPQGLPLKLYFCHSDGFSGLYILRAQVSVKFFGVFFEHLILDMLGIRFFISSEYLCFCLHFLLRCLYQLLKFSGISPIVFLNLLLFPIEFSVKRACSIFSYY